VAASRRIPLVVAIALAAVLAVVASLTTCAPDDVAQVPAGERSKERAARTPARSAPGRTPRARVANEAEVVTETTAAPVTPEPATGWPTGRIRVTVTRGGAAMPDADVLLLTKPAKPSAPQPGSSDGAYFDVPWYLGVTNRYYAGVGLPDANGHVTWAARKGAKGADGSVIFDAPVGPTYVVVAKSGDEWLVVRGRREVTPDPSRAIDVAVEVRGAAKIAGRCIDADDKPVPDAWVQAIDPVDDVPASPLVNTDASGAFALDVDGDRPSWRVRAVASRHLQLCNAEAEVVAVPADTTVSGVVAGATPIEIRMARGRSVVLDVTGEVVFNHLQVEGLVYEPSANAWGRLGGPVYGRATSSDHAFAAVPWTDAERPLMVWSWGNPPIQTAVDPRGRDRVSLKLPVGRKATVKGRGWLAGDRIRAVCRWGAPGAEIPVIWVENEVGPDVAWSRDDTPPCEVEFRLVRDGREIGARPTAPAGKDDALSLRIDL
jgi:hypothetical protein